MSAGSGDGDAGVQPARSAAQRIAGIQQLLAEDERRLDALVAESKRLDAEFEKASRDFNELDAELNEVRSYVESATDPARRSELAESLKALTDAWEQSRDNFDAIIARRKEVLNEADVLKEKIAVEETILAEMTRVVSPRALVKGSTDDAGDRLSSGVAGDTGDAAAETPDAEQSGDTELEERPAVENRAVTEARQMLAQKQGELAQAENRLKLIGRAIDTFKRDKELAQRAAEALRETLDGLLEEQKALRQALQSFGADDEASDEARANRERLASISEEIEDVHSQLGGLGGRIETLDGQLAELGDALDQTETAISASEDEVASARTRLTFLESPFAPHRLKDWLWRRGPTVLAIPLAMVLLWLAAKFLSARIIYRLIVLSRRGSQSEREERAETLRRVFMNASTLVILALGFLAILEQSGIDITVLLGGAAVFGMAIAFGAQNLIKDYFVGFMILIENQYSVGNVIKINQTAGLVENITLRMTVLRDLSGTVHFIPHGQVSSVSNLTYSWSRVDLEIGVAYKEDVNQVMEVLVGLANELKEDAEFGPLIIDEPEMLGVDAFADSAVVIKMLIKTRPLMQWVVKREMLRRTKMRFDELGIEIPFPHRTVYHRGSAQPPDGG